MVKKKITVGGKEQLELLQTNMSLRMHNEDAPICTTCGSVMTRNGTCYKCLACGETSGCSQDGIRYVSESIVGRSSDGRYLRPRAVRSHFVRDRAGPALRKFPQRKNPILMFFWIRPRQDKSNKQEEGAGGEPLGPHQRALDFGGRARLLVLSEKGHRLLAAHHFSGRCPCLRTYVCSQLATS